MLSARVRAEPLQIVPVTFSPSSDACLVNLRAQFSLLSSWLCSAIDTQHCITKFTTDKEEVKDLLQGQTKLESQLFRSDKAIPAPKRVDYFTDSVNSVPLCSSSTVFMDTHGWRLVVCV
jgi:hypothetical protein